MTRILRTLLPVLVGLGVALGMYAWRGGHYPLAVDVMALGAIGVMAAGGAREVAFRVATRD